MPTELPYDVDRLSAESGVPIRTIQRHINAGLLRAYKVDPRKTTSPWLITPDNASTYIAANTQADKDGAA